MLQVASDSLTTVVVEVVCLLMIGMKSFEVVVLVIEVVMNTIVMHHRTMKEEDAVTLFVEEAAVEVEIAVEVLE